MPFVAPWGICISANEEWRMHVELRKDMDFEGFEPHALRKTNYFHEKVH